MQSKSSAMREWFATVSAQVDAVASERFLPRGSLPSQVHVPEITVTNEDVALIKHASRRRLTGALQYLALVMQNIERNALHLRDSRDERVRDEASLCRLGLRHVARRVLTAIEQRPPEWAAEMAEIARFALTAGEFRAYAEPKHHAKAIEALQKSTAAGFLGAEYHRALGKDDHIKRVWLAVRAAHGDVSRNKVAEQVKKQLPVGYPEVRQILRYASRLQLP